MNRVLSDLYPTTADARRIVDEVEIDANRVDFSGSSLAVWTDILREAERQRLMGSLIAKVLSEYPRYPDLLTALNRVFGISAVPDMVGDIWMPPDEITREDQFRLLMRIDRRQAIMENDLSHLKRFVSVNVWLQWGVLAMMLLAGLTVLALLLTGRL